MIKWSLKCSYNTMNNSFFYLQRTHFCRICNKGFYKASCLNRHTRSHTGERPFKCDRCSKSFAQSTSLKSHLAKCTGGKKVSLRQKKVRGGKNTTTIQKLNYVVECLFGKSVSGCQIFIYRRFSCRYRVVLS